ncbi:hypothetical protein V6N13_050074 [Hibiscus sabdariffa]
MQMKLRERKPPVINISRDPSITSSTLTSSALSAAAAATSSLSPHPPTTASSSISPMLTPCSWSSLVFTHGLELVDSL